jgi:hypothetical protein
MGTELHPSAPCYADDDDDDDDDGSGTTNK